MTVASQSLFPHLWYEDNAALTVIEMVKFSTQEAYSRCSIHVSSWRSTLCPSEGPGTSLGSCFPGAWCVCSEIPAMELSIIRRCIHPH